MSNPLAEFVGDIPFHYNQGLGPVLFDPFARDLAGRLAGEARPPADVLELAAGTGILTEALSGALPEALILATDLNMPMLAMAQERCRGQDRVRFAEADAMQIGLADDSVDAIACQFGVMFFPDKVASFREARRVLKPGAPYWFNSWCDHGENPFAAITHETVAELFPDDPPAFYALPFSYPDADQIQVDLADAGFKEIQLETVRFDQPVADWDVFSRGIVFGNPLSTELAAREGADAEAVRVIIRDRLIERFGEAPTTMPLAAHVVRAAG